jgi:hypothetical protein
MWSIVVTGIGITLMAKVGRAERTASVSVKREPRLRRELFHPGARFSTLTTR